MTTDFIKILEEAYKKAGRNYFNNSKPNDLDGSDTWWLPEGADSALNIGDYPHTEKMQELPKITCECGVDMLGYGKHSDWCPKAKLEQT